MQKLRIISRNSQLALWQANFVKQELNKHYPKLLIEVIGVTTRGDKVLNGEFKKEGGKGLFIKELEIGLLNGEADVAVHSLKDMPMELNPEFTLAAIMRREDPSDAFISNKYSTLESMPNGSIIGTSSPRRVALLRKYYPNLQVKPLRGNVVTRLSKIDNGEYDGAILATAGLKRLGLESKITQRLDVTKFIPSVGQGALAIETLTSRQGLIKLVEPLIDKNTTQLVNIERDIGKDLGVGCNAPIAIHATMGSQCLNIHAMLTDEDMINYRFARVESRISDYKKAINDVIMQLKTTF